jgi:putative ABC transport system ATP-binding protein
MSTEPTSPQTSAVFEAVGLAKEFDDGRVAALQGVDFKISAGEFVALIGPSGSGKTTLLNMLGLLDSPSSGSLKYRGTGMTDLPDPSRYRAREIGFIFQSFHLLGTFSVTENVQIPMFGQGLSPKARAARAAELLDSVGLSHRLNHFPVKLSGGERQRAAIARSLANRPGVLLADEPTGNLDSKNAAHVMELLSQLQREHQTTLILVTHDLEVASHASRILTMRDGRIISDSTAS